MQEAVHTQMLRIHMYVHVTGEPVKFTPGLTNLSSMASPISPQEPILAADQRRCRR